MPNWTKNELTVEGKTKEVRRFLKHMGEGFSFEKIIPMPEECRDRGWRAWSIDNWGTKWDACDVEAEVWGETIAVICDQAANDSEVDDDFMWVTYTFQTAWDAPHPVIAQLKADWSELSFYGGYVHEGYEGCGTW